MKKVTEWSRRQLMRAAAGVLVGLASIAAVSAQTIEPASADFDGPRWVATWSVPPMAHGSALGAGSRSFDNQTVRQIIPVSVGGSRVRIKLSNEYGVGALIVGAAHVAVQSTGASTVPGTDRALTFRGQASVVIPEGAAAFSDPVNFAVPSNARLAISLYFPQNTGFVTYHENANQTAYTSAPGNFSDAVDLPVQDDTSVSRYVLTFVEVLSSRSVDGLAIIGDSISEGSTTTRDANRRVSDVLSRWYNPPVGPGRLAVLNQGTGCGRLLFDTCGPKGLARFDREVLNATGVNQVVIELGYVDIIFPTAFGVPEEIVSADQIIAGLKQLVRRARLGGLRVYGATIPPNASTPFPNVHTPENEAKRQAVNQWIRTSRQFDAVVEYDVALRDPSNPLQLLPAYDSGDGIHPNDAGHEAMARAIALSLR
ncbi:GDSL-type esterase/lipase family protein [Peristeroidobacter agariperforans]|uniref:GDSL-type esterase/lipase family protein n=1 Tax=Peristeroidobacter agariperforans TaxID=268404 RepID=UPI00101DC82B|nr:GDSL-type esterase/lipase family protein [Peristeroidobacter agariperforans]